jgi:hypothetical protein
VVNGDAAPLEDEGVGVHRAVGGKSSSRARRRVLARRRSKVSRVLGEGGELEEALGVEDLVEEEVDVTIAEERVLRVDHGGCSFEAAMFWVIRAS